MDDDPSCVAANVLNFNFDLNRHSLHKLCGLCLFAFLKMCTGV